MRKRMFMIFTSMLLVIFGFLSNVSNAYGNGELESVDTNYFLIHYNGGEEQIVFNENVTLLLKGWTDESKTSVKGRFITDHELSNQTGDTTIILSEELNEFSIHENERIKYRFILADTFQVEEIVPHNLQEKVSVVTENENGTSVEQVEMIDDYGTIIERKGLTYYSIDKNNQKVEITETEYNSLNSQVEHSPTTLPTKEAFNKSIKYQAQENPSITYVTHVQDIGWMEPVSDGGLSGTEGKNKHLESINISVNSPQDLGVKYTTHVQDYGWMQPVTDGFDSGTVGKAKQLEAIKIELIGGNAQFYDIYYRVHVEDYGWMGWAKNGELAGTTGKAKQLEAIEIMVLSKGTTPPIQFAPSVRYNSHVQDYGWLETVSNGALSGTVGKGKYLEATQIILANAPFAGGITYRAHVQDIGWQGNVSDGAISGTTGIAKPIEAIEVNLYGEMANQYDVYYRVHAETFGWFDWAKNGAPAGTEGLASHLEAIEILLVEKGGAAPGSTEKPFISKPSVVYSTHVETYGWMNYVANGVTAGTVGQAKRLEAITMNLQNTPYSGDIVYSSHVEKLGWVNGVKNGNMSGTVGQGLRLEAININLTGEIANYFDIYYRVHAEDFGWLGWAKNGMNAGSEGLAKRLEAVEIKLVPKGQGHPVNAQDAYKKPLIVFLDPGHGGYDPGSVAGGYRESDLNLSVAKKVQALLISRGYRVYMSRYDDSYVDLLERSRMANALSPNIFVSIHHNSSAGSTSIEGIESYYYQYKPEYPPQINMDMHNNPDRVTKSINLTNLIHNKLIAYSGAKNRGVGSGSFSVVRESAMPATLLELGFINNTNERQKLITDSYQNTLAVAIADGIGMYFNVY